MNGGQVYRYYGDPSSVAGAGVAQQVVDSSWPWYVPLGLGVFIFIGVLFLFNLWFGPVYSVWAARKAGEADYARAINEQNIQIAQAESRLAAAKKNKDAAIIEAEAVAEQIKKIGSDVKEHPLYLHWQWLESLRYRSGDTIYVATEANMPIMEAGRTVSKS